MATKQKYHVNPNSGLPSACGAEVRDCPWKDSTPGEGGMQGHYATREAAEKAGQEMLANRFPETKLTKSGPPQPTKAPRKLGNTEFTSEKAAAGYAQMDARHLVKKTTDPATLVKEARNGDESVLRAIAKNPNAPKEALEIVRRRSEQPKTQELVTQHPNFNKVPAAAQTSPTSRSFDPATATTEQFSNYFQKTRKVSDDIARGMVNTLNDNSAQAMLKARFVPLNVHDEIVYTKNPNITTMTKLQAMGGYSNDRFYANPNFPASEIAPHLDYVQLANLTKAPATSENLAFVSKSIVEPKLAKAHAEGRMDGLSMDLARNIANNPNTDTATRNRLAKTDPRIGADLKLGALEKKNPEVVRSLARASSQPTNSTTTAQTYTFDAAKAKELGVTGEEMAVYLGRRTGLIGTHYNAQTGEIIGYRD